MSILIPVIENNYTCMNCGGNFESQEIFTNYWFCSKSCLYRHSYRSVRDWFPGITEKRELFALTKKVVEIILEAQKC